MPVSLLNFLPHNVIIFNEKTFAFTPMTYCLLQNFCKVENYFLSKEDVRQDVCFDSNARNGTIDNCIYDARQELRKSGFPLEIETVYRKGYVLKHSETSHEITR